MFGMVDIKVDIISFVNKANTYLWETDLLMSYDTPRKLQHKDTTVIGVSLLRKSLKINQIKSGNQNNNNKCLEKVDGCILG